METDPQGAWVIRHDHEMANPVNASTLYLCMAAPVMWRPRLSAALRFSTEAAAQAAISEMNVTGRPNYSPLPEAVPSP